MKSQRKLLIFSLDSALRKAYASYLQRNGIPTDSCGTQEELKRLLSWHVYEFILINVDSLKAEESQQAIEGYFAGLTGQSNFETLLIATSKRPESETTFSQYHWFLQEPITPKRLLTTISQIRQKFPRRHSRLRKSLSKPIEFD